MKFRHSIKMKLTMIMAAVVTAVVVIVCVLNTLLLEKYYTYNRQKELVHYYDELTTKLQDDGLTSQDLNRYMREVSVLHGVNIYIINSEWELTYSSSPVTGSDIRWLQDFMFGAGVPNNQILQETDQYTVQKGLDVGANMSYIAVYGALGDGSQVVMQIVLENIRETVSISNRFVIVVGAIVLVLSMIAVFLLASGFTKPVKELSELAKEMSVMNFDAKYTGKDRGELGQLGESMNRMSEQLQADVSQLRAANLTLQKDLEIREKNEEMRRDFIANVSHELKTPIALVQSYAEGLKEGIGEDAESRDYYCDVIVDESRKMNRLVQNLLTLNELEYGRSDKNIERIEIGTLLDGILKAHKLSLEQKSIELQVDIPEPIQVWCDELDLEKVITNYLTNAIHYCEGENRILIRAFKCADKKMRMEVFNTGHPIPAADVEHIWDKFYKVDKARTRDYGGNGIGLSIVKAVMDNYQGSYGVLNQEDGVIFFFIMDCE